MRRTPEELRRLATPEFSHVLATDPELIRLEAEKYDKNGETQLLLEVMGLGDFRIGKLPIRPLTAAKWAFLWMLENRYATGGEIRSIDNDVALYVLSLYDLRDLRREGGALWEIPAHAAGYGYATGLEFRELCRELVCWRDSAFRPLELMPPADPAEESPRFDAQWLTRICAIAAHECNETLERVMYDLTLSTVCCLLVNYAQRQSAEPHRFRRRPDAELAARISARIDQLSAEFLSDNSDQSDRSDNQ